MMSDIIIENEFFYKVQSFKFHGVIMDNMYTIRKYVDVQTIINLYYILVFPYLIYCNEVWGGGGHAKTYTLIH